MYDCVVALFNTFVWCTTVLWLCLTHAYQHLPTLINTYHSLSKFINIDQPLKIVAFWNSTSTTLKQTRKQCSSYLVNVFKIINQSIWAILMSIIQSYEYWSCPPLAQKMANKRVKIVTLRQMSSYFRETVDEWSFPVFSSLLRVLTSRSSWLLKTIFERECKSSKRSFLYAVQDQSRKHKHLCHSEDLSEDKKVVAGMSNVYQFL